MPDGALDRLLAESKIFALLDEEGRKRLRAIAVEQTVPPGTALIREGEEAVSPVRPAQVEDRDEMLALFPRLAAFDVPESRIPEHLWLHDAAMLERWVAGDQDDCLVHVAVDSSETIVGIAMATLRPELLSKEPSSHLEAIAVAEGLSGKGIGSLLLDAIEKDARLRGAGAS